MAQQALLNTRNALSRNALIWIDMTKKDLFSASEWLAIGQALRLSGREFEIVQLVLNDLKESAIASQLGISAHTVHTYIERLYGKLGVTSRVQLVTRIFSLHRLLHDSPSS